MRGFPLDLRRPRVIAAGLLTIAALVACSDASPPVGADPTTGPGRSMSVGTDETEPPSVAPTAAPTGPLPTALPAFSSSVEPVSTERLGATWRAGCPVGAEGLRLVTVMHATFEGEAAIGELIIAAEVVDDVVAAFAGLYAERFPIRKMITMDAYDGDGLRSSIDDNTSGFNCRRVLGTDRLSQHSYGLAVDINPLENPYLVGGEVRPPMGADYLDRADVRPGMIVENDLVVQAFTSRGFEWGGRFVTTPDYQHFALPR